MQLEKYGLETRRQSRGDDGVGDEEEARDREKNRSDSDANIQCFTQLRPRRTGKEAAMQSSVGKHVVPSLGLAFGIILFSTDYEVLRITSYLPIAASINIKVGPAVMGRNPLRRSYWRVVLRVAVL